MGGVVQKLRDWRERQQPEMTLDAAAAEVGTVRQVWFDWEKGRRIPRPAFMAAIWKLTKGAVAPNDFYDLPPIGQLELPIEPAPAPLLDACETADEQPQLQAVA